MSDLHERSKVLVNAVDSKLGSAGFSIAVKTDEILPIPVTLDLNITHDGLSEHTQKEVEAVMGEVLLAVVDTVRLMQDPKVYQSVNLFESLSIALQRHVDDMERTERAVVDARLKGEAVGRERVGRSEK